MLQRQTLAQSSKQLLEQYSRGPLPLRPGERIRFEGVGERDVYNITAPFLDRGEPIIAGRVEDRASEFSRVLFFRQEGGAWKPHPAYPAYELQDPFFTRIRGELVFGGVRVIADPVCPGNIVSWVTEYYRGPDIAGLQWLMRGPYHMKDLRLVELPDGGIGVVTRPQGYKGGRGKIGFLKVGSYEEMTARQIGEAPLFAGQFIDEEWGGANELHPLANGLIGVLGHIASFDSEETRHYQAIAFAFRPETMETTPMKIIARRCDCPGGHAKRADLGDVVFSGGLVRKAGGTAELYVGASDAEAYKLEIPDPFLEYERL